MDNVSIHNNLCKQLNLIYKKKNHDYGDSFHKSWEEYGPVMLAIRLEDKFNRFKTLIKSEAMVDESIEDTLIDLANYALMGAMEYRRGKTQEPQQSIMLFGLVDEEENE